MSAGAEVTAATAARLAHLREEGWEVVGPTALGESAAVALDYPIGDSYYSCVARRALPEHGGQPLEIRRLGDTREEAGRAVADEVERWTNGEAHAFSLTVESTDGGLAKGSDRIRGTVEGSSITTFADFADLVSWSMSTVRWNTRPVRICAARLGSRGHPVEQREWVTPAEQR